MGVGTGRALGPWPVAHASGTPACPIPCGSLAWKRWSSGMRNTCRSRANV